MTAVAAFLPFLGRWWKGVAGAFLAALVVWPLASLAGRLEGRGEARAACQTEALEAQLAEERRQRSAADEVGRLQRARVNRLEAEVREREARNADYEAQLAAACVDGSCCAVDVDDCRMQHERWGLDARACEGGD